MLPTRVNSALKILTDWKWGDEKNLFHVTGNKKKKKQGSNTISKAEGDKINRQKSVVFLYTYNELSQREIKKAILFAISSKRIKN